jgi:UDP-N-acetylglucosamine 2-epimerase (non-hydrolysing)
MKRFEPICLDRQPSHVLVVGDVNSTIACALVAKKLGIAVVHVEAGLRSFDRTMPEEINRVLTDAIADLLFVTEESGRVNLLREGIPEKRIHLVGNVMVDTLLKHRERAGKLDILSRLGLNTGSVIDYGVLTLHRPSNVDSRDTLKGLLEALTEISKQLPIVFPVHPRTARQIGSYGLRGFLQWVNGDAARINERRSGIYAINSLSYLPFLQLLANARVALTDSGGIQEETTILKVPCVTMRENTERPVTLMHGTNRLAGTNPASIVREAAAALSSVHEHLESPPLWDGRAAQRIVEVLAAEEEIIESRIIM